MSCRCLGIICAASVFVGGALSSAAAQQPGFSQINVHNPFSSSYVSMTPIRGSYSSFYGGPVVGTTYSYVGGPAFYPGYYPYYAGYPPYVGGPFFGGTVFAPLVVPAESMYGPQAMMRFMGVNQAVNQVTVPQGQVAAPQAAIGNQAAGVAGRGAAVQAARVPPVEQPARPAPKVHASNADARARSQRFIVLGDGYFGKQQYTDANQRYRLAQQAAPDMADPYLRQGIALAALGHYESAARSLKRGLQIDPQWPDSAFTLDQLYGDAALAKAAHIEALKQEAARAPSADTLFLLGVMQFFNGEREQALPQFQRARELAAGDDAHIADFLLNLRPQAPDNEAPAPADPVAGAAVGQAAVVPLAQRNLLAPRQQPVAPFGQMPAVPKAAAAPPATPALPQRMPAAADKPARDL